jgi:ATP-dependent DNA helicase RecG
MSAHQDNLANTPVSRLKGVGPKSAERLARLGIHSVQDVLFHLPLRYQDRTRVVPVGALRPGDQAVIDVTIDHAQVQFRRRRMLLVQVSDGTGSIVLRFFHFSGAQQTSLATGQRLRCFGEVRNGPQQYELVHPEYQLIQGDQPEVVEETLTPIYPTTEGMHQLTWRDLTDKALAFLQSGAGLQELLPEAILTELQLPSLQEALLLLHRPPADISAQLLADHAHPAQQRLAFEELLAHQLSLRQLRARQQQQAAPSIRAKGDLAKQLLAQLPFALTHAQQRIISQVKQDIAKPRPMLRLVQGDVGCGKTIVAAVAALQAIEAGYQVALMAPTELLAEQHRKNFEEWLQPLGLTVGWLSSRHKGKKREALLAQMAAHEVPVVVGTHALFQDDVQFAKLGLVIVDEQHRFGVHQRLSLREKGGALVPHQLVMTATPIPRTLAMTAYADLDLSVIDELPPGRTPVQTIVLSEKRRAETISRVGENCHQGKQAYWVCTLIEESEALQCQAAEDTAAAMVEALPQLRIGLVHGRLKAADKETVMQAFKQGDIDLLVATTVVEVGVDVPNASLMVIENAERLGLAQLHQLRGRVGRGSQASHCVLMYHPPLGQTAQRRLAVMRETNDGFVVAQKDLEIRGPGEVLGTRQTGEVQFRIADLLRDQDKVPQVQALADQLLQQHPQTVPALIQRWLGDKVNYSVV